MPHPDLTKYNTAIFILTCKLSPSQRVAHAQKQAHRLFGPDRVFVIDGFITSDAKVDDLFDARLARLLSKRSPTGGEIATYATHRLGWETLLSSSWSQALFLEDDFLAEDDDLISRVVDNADRLLADGRNIVKLFDFPRERTRNLCIKRTVAGIPLIKWQRPRAGMVGYLLSRNGAQRFLSRERVFRAVDEDLKYFWELGLDIWSVPGNAVVDISASLGGSLLESERVDAKKRNLLRSLQGLLLNAHRDWHTRKAFRQRKAVLAPGETIES